MCVCVVGGEGSVAGSLSRAMCMALTPPGQCRPIKTADTGCPVLSADKWLYKRSVIFVSPCSYPSAEQENPEPRLCGFQTTSGSKCSVRLISLQFHEFQAVLKNGFSSK